MSKAKVIELVGVKLDPNAKYLILFEPVVPWEVITGLSARLKELIGPNFVMAKVPDPQNTVKVFEFVAPSKEPVA